MAAIHSDRLGRPRSLSSITLLVIHTAESSEGDNTAEVLMSLFASKGDRRNADGSYYGASYHAVTDTDGQWKQAVPDGNQAKAAAGGNVQGLHLCYPGRASQTAEQWRDEASERMHHGAAKWLAVKSSAYGIPLRKLTVAQVKAGERGVCAHDDVSKAFGKSDHWDPGPNFPWGYVLDLARQYAAGGKPATGQPQPPASPTPAPQPPATPTPEDDETMQLIGIVKTATGPYSAAWTNGTTTVIPSKSLDAFRRIHRGRGATNDQLLTKIVSDVERRAYGPLVTVLPDWCDLYGVTLPGK